VVRVLITGAAGQIGSALAAGAPSVAEVLAPDRTGLDITRESDVARAMRDFRPDLVINAAGYTAVDRAEAEPEAAHAVNAEGVALLARAAGKAGARLIHFSTDYVFDGRLSRSYRPDDPPNPLNVYGASKLAGERAVLAALRERGTVVRTAWVYASRGRNFVLTMLRLMRERERIDVVADQVGTPTCAPSVAGATWALAARPEVHGIVHWTDEGSASWFDFAVAIRDEAVEAGLLDRPAAVAPVTSAEYAAPARRPAHSVLDCSEARAALDLGAPHWRAALRRTLREIAGD
jgi:dTDP-4-dehydrorhamnose reductase